MFTGLIQCIGEIASKRHQGNEAVISVRSKFASLMLGESIAVNGACLSVTGFRGTEFDVFASRETLDVTSIGSLTNGAKVNLEKAVTLSTPLGGHLVTGHVDTRVQLLHRHTENEAVRFQFALPESPELTQQIAPKGSIALDGVSLTVNTVHTQFFEVMIIPITLEHTTLAGLQKGALVNLETDILAKYVSRRLDGETNKPNGSDISLETLLQNGFMR
ncbi:MAG: riboflavin synthase [Deltaproteobacteria bacterium]|nr:riboflavin synthase [Deltaproteobacteria bacterium]MBN2674783.1 riboflavin synthase [Deltaproteobacteria bacterium]